MRNYKKTKIKQIGEVILLGLILAFSAVGVAIISIAVVVRMIAVPLILITILIILWKILNGVIAV